MKKIIIDELNNEKEVISEYQMIKQLKSNNIVRERIELYRDFIINLIYYIHNTYLGKNFIKTDEDVKGHFNWAFNKVISEYENEGIVFGDTKDLKDYFFEFFCLKLYYSETIPSLKMVIEFWDEIFNIKNNKEKTHLNALIEIYKLFDDSLNKKIILEETL